MIPHCCGLSWLGFAIRHEIGSVDCFQRAFNQLVIRILPCNRDRASRRNNCVLISFGVAAAQQLFYVRAVVQIIQPMKRNGSVIKIRKRFSGLSTQQGKLEKMMQAAARVRSAAPANLSPSSHLTEIDSFGPNPGALRMFTYLPPDLSARYPLMVVLHGCTQTSESYDRGAGWSTLADRFGFALLLPEQQRSNNFNGCFNWFQTGDIERGHGEALSIRQMVSKMVSDRGIDPDRVFVTGLSAGGAMTSVMLATYPDVFAGGAIIAGLPYGAANNVQQAFENMFQCPARPARVWGDLVRAASPHKGAWPRISVWHGGADATVIPPNAAEIIKQWTDVHGLPVKPSFQTMVEGYPRHIWVNETGAELIEFYTIPKMAHGTPLATGKADDQCGAAGPFLLEVGISSSYHIATFFGLTETKNDRAAIVPEPGLLVGMVAETFAGSRALEGEVLDRECELSPERSHPRPSPLEIITNALKAAGLMK
jgi:poly(hydroxyalkanoate) depolymerase family esterase